jgi:DNA polymerase elongation subunit (family B)
LLEFLNTLEQLKDTGSIKKKVGKLLINSFYGRLALGDEMFIIELLTDIGDNKSYGKLDDFFIIKKKIHKNNTKANIAVAAAIASKARIKLYEAQLEVQKHGGRLLYSDTDSIFAAFNKDNPVEDKLLGKHVFFDTKKNDTKIKDAVFISAKSYAIKFCDDTEIIKIKGINIREVHFAELKYQFLNDNNNIILKNSQFSKKNFSLEHTISMKTINLQNYNKRIFINNKTDTIPLTNN